MKPTHPVPTPCRGALYLLVVLLSLPASAAAQEKASADSARAAELVRLLRTADRMDDYLRLVLVEGSVEGRVRDVAADSVSLLGGSAALADVLRVDERRKQGGGAMVGALAGGALVAALFYSFYAGLCEYSCGEGLAVGIAGLGAGAAVGGIIGGIVAPGDAVWEERWAR